ncbi:MAG: LysR family transcriptional regulator [Rhodospirillales bacterium]|jgi:DNA-binding transcriptional LysR family regulator|nr:LysR family transcriptional regulator [Rhodospirillales bacterium]
MLELRELQNFVAVAERLSVSQAAEVVHLSQPALSRQIQALEKKLGVLLFERVGKRLVLTAEGDDLLKHAASLLDMAQDFTNRAYGLKQGHVGLLRVGASPQTIAWLLSPVMAEFNATHPNVELIFSEGHNDALIDMVENGVIHIGIASPSPNHNLVSRKLFDAKLLTMPPPGDPRAKARSLSIEDIAAERIIVLKRGFLTRHMFDNACAEAGVRPRILLESDSTHTVTSLAHDGHGFAILSSSARDTGELDNAVVLASAGREIHQPVSALWNPNRYRPASLLTFVEYLEKHAAARS